MRDESGGTLTLAILLCTLTLAACGTRGPLTMPPPAKPVPASADKPTVAPDINTAKDPAK